MSSFFDKFLPCLDDNRPGFVGSVPSPERDDDMDWAERYLEED